MLISMKKAIVKKLNESFPEHRVYDEEVKQGLKKPCFFISMLPVINDFTGKYKKERSFIIDVIYMSKNETNEENYIATEILSNLFQVIETDKGNVMTQNNRFEVIDRVLHYLFDVDVTEYGKEPEGRLIQDVQVNKEVE